MRKLTVYGLWLLMPLYLFAISNYFLNKTVYSQSYSGLDIVLANSGLLLLGVVLAGWARYRQSAWLSVLATLYFFLLFFISITELIIYKYSGVAFVEQTFLHFEPHALLIGFIIHPVKYTTVVLSTLLVSVVLVYWGRAIKTSVQSIVVVVTALVLLLFFGYGSSVGRLIKNYQVFLEYQNLNFYTAEEIAQYEQFGLRPVATDNQNLTATIKGTKKNLIIVFLESFSKGFITDPNYPKLAPEMHALIDQYGAFEDYESTGSFTIQGLMSTLCGLTPKLMTGNNISVNEMPYKNLPCLSDVLNRLEYHQEFIGGAHKHFANKATFLSSKSFDQVWGWYDYKKPKEYQTNDWGLQDSDLFQFALDRAIELKNKQQPFHLSVLTLGTHLNGNPDPACPLYPHHEDKFIQSIHCTDYLLGRFIRDLEAEGLLAETTVLVTGDHGVFPVDLIKNLFGSDFERNQLLGVLIDDYQFDQTLPLALYDMAPLLLKALKIDTNATFINGRAPEEISSDRYLLRENVLVPKVDWAPGCNQNETIEAPIDPCENERLLAKSWGYAAMYSENKNLVNLHNKIEFTTQPQGKQQRVELTIDGKQQTKDFMVMGYPLTDLDRKFKNYIMALVYDIKSQTILSRNAYEYTASQAAIFKRMLRDEYTTDRVLVIFTESSNETTFLPAWEEQLQSLGAEQFNYPNESYLAIFRKTASGVEKIEWHSDEPSGIQMRVDDINQLPMTPVK